MQNYYEVLGVSSTASPKELKKAYYRATKLLHPDLAGLNQDSEAWSVLNSKLQDLNAAYSVLKDTASRAEYDKELLTQEEKARAERAERNASKPSGSGNMNNYKVGNYRSKFPENKIFGSEKSMKLPVNIGISDFLRNYWIALDFPNKAAIWALLVMILYVLFRSVWLFLFE